MEHTMNAYVEAKNQTGRYLATFYVGGFLGLILSAILEGIAK